MNVKFRIGILLAIFSFSIELINIYCAITQNQPFDASLVVVPGAAGLILAWSIFTKYQKLSDWVQVILVIVIAIMTALLGGPSQQFVSVIFYVVAFSMLYRYKLIPLTSGRVLIMILISFSTLLLGTFLVETFFRAITLSIMAISVCVSLYWLLGSEINRLTRENAKMVGMFEINQSSAQITHLLKAKTAAMESILEEDLSEEMLHLLRLSVADVQETVKQVMQFSRAGARSEPELVNVRLLVSSVLFMIQHVPEFRERIEFRSICASDTKQLMIPSEMKAVIQNLAMNAAEAIVDTGTVEVFYDGDMMSVTDTGTGIPGCASCEKSTCENCSKFEAGSTTKKNGSGYGMVQVQQFCRTNQYRLKIKSFGNGTRIEIHFK